MENQQQCSKQDETQNIENSAFANHGSRWKTGLNRFKNNISKPTILSHSSNNQENLSNQELTTSLENRRKVFIVDVDENNVIGSSLGNNKQIQNRLNSTPINSKGAMHQSSLANHSNKIKKLFLPSTLISPNSDNLTENNFFEDKKVHFNSEVSTNNDLPELQKSKHKSERPRSQFSQKTSMLSGMPSKDMVNFDKAKTQPLFYNQHISTSGSYSDSHKSFDAHFKRRKETIDAFKKKDWQISERLYNLRVQKVHKLMNWKEFNPAAKVTVFTDNYITEEVHQGVKREKQLNDLPDSSNIVEGRFKLPPERRIADYQQNRVYFWG